MPNAIYLTDRSRIVTRENCERQRFLNYDFDINGEPVGIQRVSTALPLLNGVEIHEAHAEVLEHEGNSTALEATVQRMRESYSHQVMAKGVYGEADPQHLVREQTALLEGMLRAFTRTWLPRILEDYSVVNIEKSHDWQLAPGLVQKLRFDTVLRRRGDDRLVVLDYKSMAYVSDAWALKLERSRQTSLYTQAAEEIYGEPVEIAYLGMVKGTWRKDTAKSSPFYEQKIQLSPYTYAYALKGSVGNVYQTAYTAKKGYVRVRTYDEMSMSEWIDWLWHNERSTVQELFVFNPPLAPTLAERRRVRELVTREELAYLRRLDHYRNLRDKALREGNDALFKQAQDYLDFVAAPMREERCYQYGSDSRCQFVGICFNEGALEYVLEDGEFEPREAHHATTLEDAA